MQSDFEVIQAFLVRVSPQDKETRAILGITGQQADVFWAALNAATEENLLVHKLLKLAEALQIKFPSALLTALKDKKLLQRGGKQGEWLISREAVERMRAFLEGKLIVDVSRSGATTVPLPPAPAPAEVRAVSATHAVTETTLPPSLSPEMLNQVVKVLLERVADINSRISNLHTKKLETESLISTLRAMR